MVSPHPLPLTLVCWLPWECATHWSPVVLAAEMMEAVCVCVCGRGGGHLLPDRSTVVCTLFSCTTASHIPVHTLTDTQMHTHMHSHPPCAPHKHTHTHVHTYSWTKILPLTLMHTPPHPEFSGSTCIRTHSLRFHCHKVWPAQSPTGAVVNGLKCTIHTSSNYTQEYPSLIPGQYFQASRRFYRSKLSLCLASSTDYKLACTSKSGIRLWVPDT